MNRPPHSMLPSNALDKTLLDADAATAAAADSLLLGPTITIFSQDTREDEYPQDPMTMNNATKNGNTTDRPKDAAATKNAKGQQRTLHGMQGRGMRLAKRGKKYNERLLIQLLPDNQKMLL